MKIKYPLIILFVVAALGLTGCNKNTPKEVARTWLIGFNRMDFEPAMKLSTPDTKNLLASLKELTDAVADSGKEELNKITVTIKDVKEDGDNAVVTYISSDNPREQKLNLVKQNEKWLVLFTKTDLVGVMPDKDENEADQGAYENTEMTTDSL